MHWNATEIPRKFQLANKNKLYAMNTSRRMRIKTKHEAWITDAVLEWKYFEKSNMHLLKLDIDQVRSLFYFKMKCKLINFIHFINDCFNMLVVFYIWGKKNNCNEKIFYGNLNFLFKSIWHKHKVKTFRKFLKNNRSDEKNIQLKIDQKYRSSKWYNL